MLIVTYYYIHIHYIKTDGNMGYYLHHIFNTLT